MHNEPSKKAVEKMTRQKVGYRFSGPLEIERCGNCRNFFKAGFCKLVEGRVDPSWVCDLVDIKEVKEPLSSKPIGIV